MDTKIKAELIDWAGTPNALVKCGNLELTLEEARAVRSALNKFEGKKHGPYDPDRIGTALNKAALETLTPAPAQVLIECRGGVVDAVHTTVPANYRIWDWDEFEDNSAAEAEFSKVESNYPCAATEGQAETITPAPAQKKHFAVIGRLMWDDEDSCCHYECETREEAIGKFEDEMRERKDNVDIFINHVIESATPLTIH